jgi:putative hydrolase
VSAFAGQAGSVTEHSESPGSPADVLRRIAYLLERAHEPTYRVRAFRRGADTINALSPDELRRRADAGSLTDLAGVGGVIERVVSEALAGETPVYLRRLEATAGQPVAEGGAMLRAVLKGDLHTHSDWSDGGSPIEEMARAGAALGHEYMALTDHSPRLTVANGLSAERLRRQLDVVSEINAELAPFRLLTGIEVDILEDGTLDQEPDLLSELDVVVASVHSKLRMPSDHMTPRMVRAIANPHVDVLGHCTGRIVVGKGRPESQFDAEIVFAACARFGVAVEVNSRPERLDPPKRLLRLAVEAECRLSIDTDAHAPGQLEWQPYGCERAAACGISPDSLINAWPLDELLEWLSGANVT